MNPAKLYILFKKKMQINNQTKFYSITEWKIKGVSDKNGQKN